MWKDYKNDPEIKKIAQKHGCNPSTVRRLVKKMREMEKKMVADNNEKNSTTLDRANSLMPQEQRTSNGENEIAKEIWQSFLKGEQPVTVVGKVGRPELVEKLYWQFLRMKNCDIQELHRCILTRFLPNNDLLLEDYRGMLKKQGYLTNEQLLQYLLKVTNASYEIGYEEAKGEIVHPSRNDPPKG